MLTNPSSIDMLFCSVLYHFSLVHSYDTQRQCTI
ncbi:unnamed protein product [Brassica oleracea var. botrytis]